MFSGKASWFSLDIVRKNSNRCCKQCCGSGPFWTGSGSATLAVGNGCGMVQGNGSEGRKVFFVEAGLLRGGLLYG